MLTLIRYNNFRIASIVAVWGVGLVDEGAFLRWVVPHAFNGTSSHFGNLQIGVVFVESGCSCVFQAVSAAVKKARVWIAAIATDLQCVDNFVIVAYKNKF